MLFWFIGGATAIVWLVFKDPRFDERLLAVGAVAPDAIDVFLGGARIFHAIVAPVAVLVLVMAGTTGRRPIRRRLLAVPIGMLLHLVLDGVFRDTRVFWWPFTGVGLPSSRLPSLTRGWWNVPLELVGVLIVFVLAPRWRQTETGSVPTC